MTGEFEIRDHHLVRMKVDQSGSREGSRGDVDPVPAPDQGVSKRAKEQFVIFNDENSNFRLSPCELPHEPVDTTEVTLVLTCSRFIMITNLLVHPLSASRTAVSRSDGISDLLPAGG